MSEEQVTLAEMQIAIKAEKTAREKRASERIQVILKEERCALNPTVTLSQRGITTKLEITALD